MANRCAITEVSKINDDATDDAGRGSCLGPPMVSLYHLIDSMVSVDALCAV